MIKQRLNRNRGARLSACLIFGALLFAGSSQASTLVDFQFNEATGSVINSRVNGLTGSLGRVEEPANVPSVSADSPSQAGSDKSVLLNGVGFLVVDDSTNSVLNQQTNAITIEAWVKPDLNDTRAIQGIVGYGNTYKLGIMNGELVFTLFGVVDVRSGVFVPYGEWHHVAAVYEPGNGVTFYFDGAPAFIAETGIAQPRSSTFLTVGGERLDNAFMGGLDRLRIHKGALTAEQLDSVAATSKAVTGNTLVAYNFNESAMPFQSAASTPRPTIDSESFFAARSRPAFSTDTASGLASDRSLRFTQGTYALVPDAAGAIALDAANPNFTLQAWVKFDAVPQQRSVLFGFNGPGGAFSLSVTSDRKLFVTTYGIADTASDAVIPNDGSWHHVAVVHENGKELRFYVDGVLADTKAYTGGVLVGVRTDTTMTIGLEPGMYNPYVGLMDRVQIWNEALRPDQLDYLAVPGVNPNAPTLTTATVMEVSWPTIPAGYKLQSTSNVEDASTWTYVTNAPFAGEGKYKLYVPLTNPRTFYRLVKP